MIKLINKFILAAAKRIENKENTKFKNLESIHKLHESYKNEATQIIEDFIDEIEDKMYEVGCHIESGDTAILNYYELDYPCRNGWDTGPDEILRNVSVEEKRTPLKVKIQYVRISRSYYIECLDKFFEKYEADKLKVMLDSKSVIHYFTNFMQGRLWDKNYGLYFEAAFEPINFRFNPQWGLNVGSFLKEGTNGAKFTEKYWKKRGQILTKWEKVNFEKNQFVDVELLMLKKYKNNEI